MLGEEIEKDLSCLEKIAGVYGTPIIWAEFSHLPKKDAQIALAKRLEESIEGLKKWYESGAKGTPP